MKTSNFNVKRNDVSISFPAKLSLDVIKGIRDAGLWQDPPVSRSVRIGEAAINKKMEQKNGKQVGPAVRLV